MDAISMIDRLLAADRERQHLLRLRELRADLANLGTRCGDCDKWMKSRQCPKEVNVNGRSRGPSAEAPICTVFSLSAAAITHRDRLMLKIEEHVHAS